MATRRPIVAANWKMHKTVAEAQAFIQALAAELGDPQRVDVVICPSFTALAAVGQALQGTPYKMGAQNVHWEKQGAFTGEINAAQLLDLGCASVIIGHSERRHYFGETDETVNKRLKAAYAANLQPILCIGETLAQRQAGKTNEVVAKQLMGALAGLSAQQISHLVIAYEPVWAIGTGVASTPDDAQEVAAYIRGLLAGVCGQEGAQACRIQYGGSVNPVNAGGFFAMPDVDGALVGGASLDASSFAAIVKAAVR